MNIKAVIFDLDGVLCSSDEYHYLAWKKLTDELCINFDRDINNRLRGVSRKESLKIILSTSTKTYTQEEKQKFMAQKNSDYVHFLKTNMSENDLELNVKNLLLELKRRGVKIAIGSSSKNAKLILNLIKIEKMFDVIIDGTMITNSKPSPEVFLKAAKSLGVLPSESLVVEDAASGIAAAKAGGFTSVYLCSNDEDKSDIQYDIKILNIIDVLKFI